MDIMLQLFNVLQNTLFAADKVIEYPPLTSAFGDKADMVRRPS
jgi:hypothetical protein